MLSTGFPVLDVLPHTWSRGRRRACLGGTPPDELGQGQGFEPPETNPGVHPH